jgi:predicted ester cyclase
MKTLKNTLTVLTIFSILLLLSCQDKQAQEELLKFQQIEATEASNIEVVKQSYKFLDEHNLEAWRNLMSPDCKGYLGSSKEPMNFDDLIPMIDAFYTAFPDYTHITEDIFAADDYVVTRMKYTGTHLKKFMELDSTGNKIKYKGIFIFKLADGKITEVYGVEDELMMLTQLGLSLQ